MGTRARGPSDSDLREIMQSRQFSAYLRYVAPGDLERYKPHVFYQPFSESQSADGKTKWCQLSGLIDLKRVIATHLFAGMTGVPQYLPRRRQPINAVGIAHPTIEDEVEVIRLDADGGYDPYAIADALESLFGMNSFLMVSSSGRPGRFHLLLRLTKPTKICVAKAWLARILSGKSFDRKLGSLEIYPARGNCRLPFGRGGCVMADRYFKNDSHAVSPLELVDILESLTPIDIPNIQSERRSGVVRILTRETQAGAMRQQSAAAKRVRSWTTRSLPVAKIEAWIRDGVKGFGERDEATYEIALYWRLQGRRKDQVEEALKRWVREGGLKLSRIGGDPEAIEAEIKRIEQLVTRVFALKLRTPSANLSHEDLANLHEFLRKRDLLRGHVVAMLLAVLPRFKAVLGGSRREAVPIHHWFWRFHGGKHYADFRDQVGIFRQARKHRSKQMFGSEASAAFWSLVDLPFQFSREKPPDRALVPLRGRSEVGRGPAPRVNPGKVLRDFERQVSGTETEGVAAKNPIKSGA